MEQRAAAKLCYNQEKWNDNRDKWNDNQEKWNEGSNATFPTRNGTAMIDFAIAGFEKCGTTTLMKTTALIPGVFMGSNMSNNKHEVHDLRLSDYLTFKERYKDHMDTYDARGRRLLNGFKSPEVLQSQTYLNNIERYFPNIDLVVSMRHPVLHFQKLYNFKFRNVDAFTHPDPLELIGNCDHDCKDNCTVRVAHMQVCTGKEYFHRALSRLCLTPLNTEDERNLLDHHLRSLHPGWKGRLLLMELRQLADRNHTRKDVLERSYEKFLGVETGLYKSKGRTVSTYSKEFEICNEKYAPIRKVLVEVGTKASRWITEYLLRSDRVVVANRDHFIESLELWKYDPCV